MNAIRKELHVHQIQRTTGQPEPTRDADPVTTEIIRHALDAAARYMKRAMIRAAFSPQIFESLDFAVVLYDRQIRMLSQAPTVPVFMGTMGFCIEAAVSAVGGEQVLEPGDVLIYNSPYGTGSHAQDCAIVMPVFLSDGKLVGYAANKAHWQDIGAMAPYCTNTTDVYQEGVVIPGLKLYRAGVRNEDLYRMIKANCRFPRVVEGDLHAQIASCHVGARELIGVIERFGIEKFESCIERMFDHGEHVVREFIQRVPDGIYRAKCHIDNNGIDETPIDFDIVVTVEGSNARFDFSHAPDAHRGPINCPLPSTVCTARITMAILAGNARETPNEGHFRPLEVVTRPGSMFHPVAPQPCYLYGWPILGAMEGIFEVFAKATGGRVPSGSAGGLVGWMYYGKRQDTGEPFQSASILPVGHGASASADGGLMFVGALAHAQSESPELQEAKVPVLFEKWEFTPDSAGPGRYRGGCGWEVHFTVRSNVLLISGMEATKCPSWAQQGGLSGSANRFEIDFPDGHMETLRKATDFPVPEGSRLRLYCGGGGGYGAPAERNPAAVRRDLLEGVITAEHVRKFYPQAL